MTRAPHAARVPGMSPTPSVGLLRALRRLRVVGNVLCVAAHPDDENTRLLSWLVHGTRVRAGYMSLTRGEGGQNLIGAERAPLLGLIRAQELLAARRVDGAEQFFGTQADFGYSKSRQETLAFWNREQALGEIVAVIRHFRPDVIVTRFSPDEEGTHGHHTTSALLAVDAFTAAADPQRFPEQIEALGTWQATRVVWNWFNLGETRRPEPIRDFIAVDVGQYDPLLGESYPEMAARSLTMHKTQGFGSGPIRGHATEYFRLLAGEAMQTSIFDGIDHTWARVAGSEALDALLARAVGDFDIDAPWQLVPLLADAIDALHALPSHPWKDETHHRLCEVIAGCAALHVSARTGAGQVTPGSRSRMSVHAIVRSPVPVAVTAVDMRAAGAPTRALAARTALVPGVTFGFDADVDWPGCPGEAQVDVDVVVEIAGRSFTLSRPLIHTWLDPLAGERWEPVTVVPAVTVNATVPVVICPDPTPRTLSVRLRAFAEELRGTLRIEPPPGACIEPLEQPFQIADVGDEQVLTFTVTRAATGTVRFFVNGAGARDFVRLDYPHIPPITFTRDLDVRLVRFDMARAGDRIGYIAGAGDEVAPALRQVGYDVTLVTDDAMEADMFSGYDAIVTGIRAFNTSRRLAAFMPRLMSYVEAGGTLVVQYNTNTALMALQAAIGPYPFTIGEDRVCDENAEIRLRDPNHPVFTWPNRIGPADFRGWVQERGLCFSTTWDPHYVSLISTHDSGEPPRDGGLLVASHGAGRVVYTGLAFFRQLPAGVPGAFRLFANLLARRDGLEP